jgi:hypothetical protein
LYDFTYSLLYLGRRCYRRALMHELGTLRAYLDRESVKLADYERWRIALQDDGRESAATTQRIRKLERELARKEKALAEAAALLVLKKR